MKTNTYLLLKDSATFTNLAHTLKINGDELTHFAQAFFEPSHQVPSTSQRDELKKAITEVKSLKAQIDDFLEDAYQGFQGDCIIKDLRRQTRIRFGQDLIDKFCLQGHIKSVRQRVNELINTLYRLLEQK
ncbi:hypothetical protein QWY77_06025 [Thalassotalea ponticola]|uniref:hypothetical protein n=1 Tax=Thalassotalea ponticola TaxID=1523392 RepID=UPI0025B523EF|nr:hypothetical protein [Thalassotalea ponticola]MDN3652317.1 hypothetical protein [Thalassotalea ponticola]